MGRRVLHHQDVVPGKVRKISDHSLVRFLPYFSSRPLFRSVGWVGNTETRSTATHCKQTETEVPKNAAMWYGSYGIV
jgi:hypothetical protein